MRLHILGICGTFMSGIAVLAKQAGHQVSGSDMNIYPPMSTQLMEQGISLMEGYDPKHIPPDVDCIIVGNVIKRGNPSIEYVLNQGLPFTSGPEWLYNNVLKNRWVLAASGTHGKTTTTSLLTWILYYAGLNPGFLIGGIPENFNVSAALGSEPYFVIEADEYDSAFFDKRSKFIHYRPKTAILNNLEYDHADIFPDLAAIKQQFHYFIRTIPSNGLIIRPAQDENIDDVLAMGCYTPVVQCGSHAAWQAKLIKADASVFEVMHDNKKVAEVNWDLVGEHNVANALAAIAAAHHAGVKPSIAIEALTRFKNVKRRLEVKGQVDGITIYDDFAHHPTAIATTLSGLRAKIGGARLIAILEFGSYTMRAGVHRNKIQRALEKADMVICKTPSTDWGLKAVLADFKQPTALYDNVDTLIESVRPSLQAGDHVIIMSNSSFDGLHNKLLSAIKKGE